MLTRHPAIVQPTEPTHGDIVLLLLLLLLLLLQEIQECCKSEALPKTSPDQLLQLFWDRQAQAAAAEASAAAAAAAGTAPAAAPVRSEAVVAAAAGVPGGATAAAAGGQAALSRYRSDFQELHPLGRGGFGVVVAAINRYACSHCCAAVTGALTMRYCLQAACTAVCECCVCSGCHCARHEGVNRS
jgi:hypothetical protein